MIKIENTDVFGFASAIRGMRNPLNSWYKSDSHSGCANEPCTECVYFALPCDLHRGFVIGDADRALMMQLVKAGSDHSKFMRMITVTCDITAPLYFNKELDTYKVGTVRNSCSTMHTIHKKEFEESDFSFENVPSDVCGIDCILGRLNYARSVYLKTHNKLYWYAMIQMLPESYNQRYTWQANYAVLRNIYHARKSHKLSEWHDFCAWIESLPYSELITYSKEGDVNNG